MNEVSKFSTHRAELEAFVTEVTGSDIRFVGVSYAELWNEWEKQAAWAGREEHVAGLRARYVLPVPAS